MVGSLVSGFEEALEGGVLAELYKLLNGLCGRGDIVGWLGDSKVGDIILS